MSICVNHRQITKME